MPIERLGLTPPTLEAVRRFGCRTIADLARQDVGRLAGVPDRGVGFASEVIRALEGLGIRPSDEAPAIGGPGSLPAAGPGADTPLESAGLSVRCSNALRRAGLVSVADVAALHISQLEVIPNFGRGSISEVTRLLDDVGLSLADRPLGGPPRRAPGPALETLRLSEQTRHALREAGLMHLGDVAALGAEELMDIPGLDQRGLVELMREPLLIAARSAAVATERPGAHGGRSVDATPTPSPRVSAMVEMRREGRTLQEIAERFGLTRERVRQIVVAQGVGTDEVRTARRERERADVEREHARIIELYREGRPSEEIARMVGLRAVDVRDALRAHATAADRAARVANRRTPRARYSDEDLVQAVRRAAQELGEVPTATAYQEVARRLGLPSLPTVANRLGSWTRAVDAAGMTPNAGRGRYVRRWSSEACWRALRQLIDELGDPPTAEQYELLSAANDDLPSLATVRHRLGRWSTIMERLLSVHDHPILDRLGIGPDTPPADREERILLAYLGEEIGDAQLAILAREGLFAWRDEYGDPPEGLGSEDP